MMVLATIQDLTGALVHLSGFLFVLFVLSLLWIVMELIGGIFKRKSNAAKPVSQGASAAAVPVAKTSGDEVSDEELVVIASTVAILLGQRPHRLVSIRSNMDWGRDGRRQHLHSHIK